MKALLLVPALLFSLVAGLAAAPQPMTDYSKTLSAAAKDEKLAFLLLGRGTCTYCNATKAMIKEGRITLTSADFVVGYLNIDDPRTEGEFMRRYGTQKFGDTLPLVVVTDPHGKPLASSSGPKDAGQWNALLAQAKSKAATAKAATAGGADANWPVKTTPPPQ